MSSRASGKSAKVQQRTIGIDNFHRSTVVTARLSVLRPDCFSRCKSAVVASTRQAVSENIFEDGITLHASASCDDIGVEFDLDTFRGDEAAPYAWKGGKVRLRTRINGGDVSTAIAEAEYTNEARVVFYEPAVIEGLSGQPAQKSQGAQQDRGAAMAGLLGRFIGGH